MVNEILDGRGTIQALKANYAAHPEKYPRIPGKTYRIIVYESDGVTRVKKQSGRFQLENPVHKIEAVPQGFEKRFVTFSLD